jgi:MFS family permease
MPIRDAVVRTDETSPSYPGWRVALASSLGVFVGFGSLLVYTFGIFLKPLTEEFGWSRQAVSVAFGIASMTVAAGAPLIGHLLDRFGPRRIVVPCVVVFGSAFASLALMTHRLWHLYAVFVIMGIVGSGTTHLAYTRAVSSWFDRRRGMALAFVMSGGAMGAIMMPPAAQALIDGFGWRRAAAGLGCLVLAVGLPIVARFITERPGVEGPARMKETDSAVPEALSSRTFWILVVVLFLSAIAVNGAIAHLAALLTDRGVPAGSAALAMSAMGAASLAGRLATGWLLDRFFAPRVSFCLLFVAALGVFLLSSVHSLAAGILAAVLIGAGMGGEADVTPYLLTRYFGLKSFSTLYGFTWTAYAVAAAIGPVLMGAAFDATSSYHTFLKQVSALTLASAGLMLFLPKYRV